MAANSSATTGIRHTAGTTTITVRSNLTQWVSTTGTRILYQRNGAIGFYLCAYNATAGRASATSAFVYSSAAGGVWSTWAQVSQRPRSRAWTRSCDRAAAPISDRPFGRPLSTDRLELPVTGPPRDCQRVPGLKIERTLVDKTHVALHGRTHFALHRRTSHYISDRSSRSADKRGTSP